LKRALALAVALAACGHPPPPSPALSESAPDAARDPVLLYVVVSQDTSTLELRWVSADGARGGEVPNPDHVARLGQAVATPAGTWLVAGAARVDRQLVLVRRAGDRVLLQHVPAPGVALVSPAGTRALVACADHRLQCVAPLDASGLGARTPIAGWVEGDAFVGWRGADVLVAQEPTPSDRVVYLVDPTSGARSLVGRQSANTSLAGVDPTGTAIVAFDHDRRTAWLVALAHPERALHAVPARETASLDGCTAPDPATLVCVELVHVGAGHSRWGVASFTAGGRSTIAGDAETELAAASDRVAYVDDGTRSLVVTDLRGENRRVLARIPAGARVTPLAWLP
jgi:hypothetical protein